MLEVGQSYTFDIEITSSETFVSAVAKVDMYYPGKGVFWHASTDLASQSNTATLHLTVIGKSSTADLAAVCDWPAEGVCWPAGVAPPDDPGRRPLQGRTLQRERLPVCSGSSVSRRLH